MKWKLLLLLPLLALPLLFSHSDLVFGSDSGALLADAAVNDATVGTTDWATPTASLTDDANGGICGCRLSGAVLKSSIRLFVGGVVAGDDKSDDGTWVTGVLTLGGAADLWGLTPTPAEINAIDFGIGISAVGNGGTSKYLYISDFDFAIPTDATINGIEAAIDVVNNGNPFIDYVSIKVYYTEAVVAGVPPTTQVQISNGSINISNGSIIIK